MNEWEKFNTDVITSVHQNIYFYRDLYNGNHAKLFPRAADLVDRGVVTDQLMFGAAKAKIVKPPYIVANVCKLIVEITATYVARSVGTITTSIPDIPTEEEDGLNEATSTIIDNELNNETKLQISGPLTGQAFNTDVLNKQRELIKEIVKNSKLDSKHYGNIIQQQIDGGLVGVPYIDDRGAKILFKGRDVYFPHEDGKGVDISVEIKRDGKEYLHVQREREEDIGVSVEHILYSMETATRKTKRLPDLVTQEILGMRELKTMFPGRTRLFVDYMANDESFMNPLGVSALKGQDSNQDEINWSLTRNAITFERNGRPRVSVTTGIMEALKEEAFQKYGDERMIDPQNLEITEMDENGNSIKTMQIDVSAIGDVAWVKDLMKLMLMETQTSERAVDFYLEGGGGAQSGVAKYYDLLTSLMKAERVQAEYVRFLKNLVESTLYLHNQRDKAVLIEEPEIQLNSMLPTSRKELLDENNTSYKDGTQALETTIRRNNPLASDEWIEQELQRVVDAQASTDSNALVNGAATAAQYLQQRKDERANATTEGDLTTVIPNEGANTDET